MARGTKSSKGSGKQAKSTDEETKPQDSQDVAPTTDSESENKTADDAPVVIEGEATEVEAADSAKEADGDASETTVAETSDDEPVSDSTDEDTADVAAESDTDHDTEHAVPGAIHPKVDEATSVAPPPVLTAPPPPQSSGGGFFGTVLGGVIAAAIGFGLATYGAPRGWLSFAGVDGAPGEGSFASPDDVAAQSGRIDSLETSVGELSQALDGISTGGAEVDLAPLEGRIDNIMAEIEALQAMPVVDAETGNVDLSPIQTALADVTSQLETLDTRLAALEETAGNAGDSGAMEEQLSAFRAEMDGIAAEAQQKIDEAQNRAAEIEAEAAAAEARAVQVAALAEVKAAIDNGAGFSEALGSLDAAPEALAAVADEGVPTLSDLQRTFPAAARSALAASTTVAEDAPAGSRFVSFLRRQTNARSLAPREGDSADAILSRAEAALGDGDLGTTMSELSALSDDAREAMSGWIQQAETRVAALDAVSTLSDELN